MIHLGLDSAAKVEAIGRYCAEHGVRKVVIFSPEKLRLAYPEAEHVEWADAIKYTVYYRLRQEIDERTLLVFNESLRVQDRRALTYNCLRNFSRLTSHLMAFQYLPIIDSGVDFAILFDLVTKSRWIGQEITAERLRETTIHVTPVPLTMGRIPVATTQVERRAYAKKKRQLIDGLGSKDPHTIPRNLYLLGGELKLRSADPARAYVGRNKRLSAENFGTYADTAFPKTPYVALELPHNFLSFTDFLTISRQTSIDVLVADLRVDEWYMSRYEAWLGRLRDAYKMLSGAA